MDGNAAVHIEKIKAALALCLEGELSELKDLKALRTEAIAYLMNELKPTVTPPTPAPATKSKAK